MATKKQVKLSEEVIDEICGMLAKGESLSSIIDHDDMPSYTAVMNWQKADPQILERFTRAREIGCHVIAEDCIRIADKTQEGVETTVKADGSVEEKRGDMLGHRRLRIETRMRLLGKWLPLVYGEKVSVGGDENAPPIRYEKIVREIIKPPK